MKEKPASAPTQENERRRVGSSEVFDPSADAKSKRRPLRKSTEVVPSRLHYDPTGW